MSESEAELIQRCQQGDRIAYGILVKRYAGKAIGSAALMLGSQHDAQDAAQEAFVRAWRSIRRFTGQSKFSTWFHTILRNICVDRLRKRKRRGTPGELHDVHAHPNPDCDPVHQAEQAERRRRVWQAIQQLSDAHREVIVLNHFQHMSYREMAEVLNIPFGTVTSRLHAARKALRDRLDMEGQL
jgi:RNA polymerase sigma-70 factor (ECF subfamily)